MKVPTRNETNPHIRTHVYQKYRGLILDYKQDSRHDCFVKWSWCVNVCCSEAVESGRQIAARGAEPPGQRGGVGPGRGARHQVRPLTFHLCGGGGTGYSAAGRGQPYHTEEHVQQATWR